jgi:hypothetical protein
MADRRFSLKPACLVARCRKDYDNFDLKSIKLLQQQCQTALAKKGQVNKRRGSVIWNVVIETGENLRHKKTEGVREFANGFGVGVEYVDVFRTLRASR